MASENALFSKSDIDGGVMDDSKYKAVLDPLCFNRLPIFTNDSLPYITCVSIETDRNLLLAVDQLHKEQEVDGTRQGRLVVVGQGFDARYPRLDGSLMNEGLEQCYSMPSNWGGATVDPAAGLIKWKKTVTNKAHKYMLLKIQTLQNVIPPRMLQVTKAHVSHDQVYFQCSTQHNLHLQTSVVDISCIHPDINGFHSLSEVPSPFIFAIRSPSFGLGGNNGTPNGVGRVIWEAGRNVGSAMLVCMIDTSRAVYHISVKLDFMKPIALSPPLFGQGQSFQFWKGEEGGVTKTRMNGGVLRKAQNVLVVDRKNGSVVEPRDKECGVGVDGSSGQKSWAVDHKEGQGVKINNNNNNNNNKTVIEPQPQMQPQPHQSQLVGATKPHVDTDVGVVQYVGSIREELHGTVFWSGMVEYFGIEPLCRALVKKVGIEKVRETFKHIQRIPEWIKLQGHERKIVDRMEKAGGNWMLRVPSVGGGCNRATLAGEIARRMVLKNNRAKMLILVHQTDCGELFENHLKKLGFVYVASFASKTRKIIDWKATLRKLDIMILTSQMFNNHYTVGAARFSEFNWVVLDECDCARSATPHNVAMLSYRQSRGEIGGPKLPRIVGMTSRPASRTGLEGCSFDGMLHNLCVPKSNAIVLDDRGQTIHIS